MLLGRAHSAAEIWAYDRTEVSCLGKSVVRIGIPGIREYLVALEYTPAMGLCALRYIGRPRPTLGAAEKSCAFFFLSHRQEICLSRLSKKRCEVLRTRTPDLDSIREYLPAHMIHAFQIDWFALRPHDFIPMSLARQNMWTNAGHPLH